MKALVRRPSSRSVHYIVAIRLVASAFSEFKLTPLQVL